jgi:CheY-like chemotaxis protein
VGSCFALDLALPVRGPATATAAAPTPWAAPVSLALSVLLVEDHPDVAEALAGLMQAWGCRVQRAGHALAALPLLEAHAFDVAVLDIDLPGVDGFELASLLKGRVPRLVALTARSDAASEVQARLAGFDLFLRKPAEAEALRAALGAGV